MCVIVDSNMFFKFDFSDKDMKPVFEWITKKNGKIVYTDYGKYAREIKKGPEKFRQFLQNSQMSKNTLRSTRLIKEERVKKAERQIQAEFQHRKFNFKSNDRHILELAKAAKVRLLITNDGNLEQDFKTIIGGKIYKDPTHKHLLTPDTCKL